MYSVELYGRVRRAVLVEGQSERAVAREFGIARETVRKMLRYSIPPGYRREQPVKRPKLRPWVGVTVTLETLRDRLVLHLPRPYPLQTHVVLHDRVPARVGVLLA